MVDDSTVDCSKEERVLLVCVTSWRMELRSGSLLSLLLVVCACWGELCAGDSSWAAMVAWLILRFANQRL